MTDRVAEAIRVLREAGRADLLTEDARGEEIPRVRPQRRAFDGVAAAVLACSARTKWRRVGEEPRASFGEVGTRAAASRQCAEDKGAGSPGGTGISLQSPGGTSRNKPDAISAMQGKTKAKGERDTQAHKALGPQGVGPNKGPQQGLGRQQDTIALWTAGEMGQRQPVKSHEGQVIDLQWDSQSQDIDLEEIGPPEGGMDPGTAWWAPAPPKFSADSWEWSEDEEEWLCARDEVVE